ncbi:hypothetical protein FBU30_002258 [Linnemannia zychae]|nr:hypothetical protein FBU30_002258 [Linnemannia zychae]
MFRKHGGLIRSLALEGPTSQKEILRGLECTQLEQLRISATIPVMEPKLWSVILPNTSGNGTLRWSSTDSTRYSGSAGAGGRWNLLLSVEGDDDEGTNISGSHKEYSDKIDKSHVDNESNANDDGESSEDSFWSSWNRSDREDEYESDDSIESTKDDDSLICQIDMWKSLADLSIVFRLRSHTHLQLSQAYLWLVERSRAQI